MVGIVIVNKVIKHLYLHDWSWKFKRMHIFVALVGRGIVVVLVFWMVLVICYLDVMACLWFLKNWFPLEYARRARGLFVGYSSSCLAFVSFPKPNEKLCSIPQTIPRSRLAPKNGDMCSVEFVLSRLHLLVCSFSMIHCNVVSFYEIGSPRLLAFDRLQS